MTENILERARDIHARNVTAGWWSDLKTGEAILTTRNRPEMLMLVVSELSEANEGLLSGGADDKLPHLPMFPVELADAAIRLLDLIGAEETVHGKLTMVDGKLFDMVMEMRNSNVTRSLMTLVDCVSAAMEHFRKGRVEDYRRHLGLTLETIFSLAEDYGYSRENLWDIIDQKLAYNASRSDHKIENRRAAGGKAF